MPKGPDLLERLKRWKEWPSFNEDATLLGLVLPILQEAGYDPFNPEEVFPQAKDSNNLKPDLLLYKGSARQEGAPYMVIEVKAFWHTANIVPQGMGCSKGLPWGCADFPLY